MQISLPDTQNISDQNVLQKGKHTMRAFLAKFNHDWMMQLSAGLAYNLMIAVVPIGIALIAVLGFTVGNLNPAAQAQLIDRIKHIFPAAISSQDILQPALQRLSKSAGLLAGLAVVVAIFGGSRLFIAIERCFDIIYRTHPRQTLRQNGMALAMMVVFIVLTPIMVLASALPALLISLVQSSLMGKIPLVNQLAHNGLILNTTSILGSILVAWILFQVTYMAVPHQKISFQKSWKGAIVGAVLLEVFLFLFPFYITHFMSSYTGVAGFAVIFLLFFYYFALILLFGAEVNAYFAEGVQPLPDTLATVLHTAASGPSDKIQEQQLARSDSTATTQHAASTRAGATSTPGPRLPNQHQLPESDPTREETVAQVVANRPEKHKRDLAQYKRLTKKKVQPDILIPTLVGTALAFGVTLINLRKKR